jgi:hypothetical protein
LHIQVSLPFIPKQIPFEEQSFDVQGIPEAKNDYLIRLKKTYNLFNKTNPVHIVFLYSPDDTNK